MTLSCVCLLLALQHSVNQGHFDLIGIYLYLSFVSREPVRHGRLHRAALVGKGVVIANSHSPLRVSCGQASPGLNMTLNPLLGHFGHRPLRLAPHLPSLPMAQLDARPQCSHSALPDSLHSTARTFHEDGHSDQASIDFS